MKRILVAYATFAGSTAEVAAAIGEELAKHHLQVDVLTLSEVKGLADYDGIVVGGPMIMGWHRTALRFLQQNRALFQRIPLAVFVTALSLTQSQITSVEAVPVYIDEQLPKPPQKADQLTWRERYTQLANYIRPIIKAVHPAKPKSIGVFGGRMEYGRLKWWAVLFAMVIIKAPAGDKRNWTAIRAWAAELPAALKLDTIESKETVAV
jgi:menaquinone-dependent protoporphyrinogen oxidase